MSGPLGNSLKFYT